MKKYPYLVCRLIPGVDSNTPIDFPSGLKEANSSGLKVEWSGNIYGEHGKITDECREVLQKIGREKQKELKLRVCVVYSEVDCDYIETDGSIEKSNQPPTMSLKIGDDYEQFDFLTPPWTNSKGLEMIIRGISFSELKGNVAGHVVNDGNPGIDGAIYAIEPTFFNREIVNLWKYKEISMNQISEIVATVKNYVPIQEVFAELESVEIFIEEHESVALGLPYHVPCSPINDAAKNYNDLVKAAIKSGKIRVGSLDANLSVKRSDDERNNAIKNRSRLLDLINESPCLPFDSETLHFLVGDQRASVPSCEVHGCSLRDTEIWRIKDPPFYSFPRSYQLFRLYVREAALTYFPNYELLNSKIESREVFPQNEGLSYVVHRYYYCEECVKCRNEFIWANQDRFAD